MKVWEVARKPKIVVTAKEPATYVRALLRDSDEDIAIVVEDDKTEKFAGYITTREVIQITSHFSSLRAKDLALDYPVAYKDEELDEVYRRMVEEKVVAVPVLDSKDTQKVVGVITLADIIRGLKRAGYKPQAETVAEVMTTDDLDKLLTTPDERVNRVWSDLVSGRILGKVVVKSPEEPVPWGIITLREFVETSRWFFHRESERGLKSVAKVRSIMLRGAPAATPDTPVELVADFMVEHGYTVLPVIDDETGRVVGVITIEDVARAYIEGAKPGRVKPTVRLPTPVPAGREEMVEYASTSGILKRVLVEKPVEERLSGLRAGDVARPELPAISINDTVEHARRVMLRYRTGYVIVVDDQGRIQGVVTKWSMLRAIGLKGPVWSRRVYDKFFIDFIMDKDLPRVKPTEPIENVALKLVRSRAEVAIVVDEDGKIVGFITKDDLVEAYRRLMAGRARVENIMTPGRMGLVHPHHTLHHAVTKMQNLYLDALTVYDGSQVVGVVSANRLPFVAYEGGAGRKSRRLVWVRKLVRGAARLGRYVKIVPLLVIDATTSLRGVHVRPEDDVVKAIDLMKKHNVDGIPVVSDDGKPLGIVTKTDIVRELARTAQVRVEKAVEIQPERRTGEAETKA